MAPIPHTIMGDSPHTCTQREEGGLEGEPHTRGEGGEKEGQKEEMGDVT